VSQGVVARCSCGYTFIGPATMMVVKLLRGHWEQGHTVTAESPVAFRDIEAVARRMADNERAARLQDEREKRWRAGSLFR